MQLLDLEGENSDDASDIEKEMEQRVNPLHLIPQLTMNSRGSKKFDFGVAAKDNAADNDWMSLGSDRKIALSDAGSAELDDCQVVNADGGDNFDYISDGFDAYSMASLPEFTVGVDSTAKKGNNFCYTPSNKSQLRVKMMSNSFADDSMSMCSAPKFSPCSSKNSRVSSSEQP